MIDVDAALWGRRGIDATITAGVFPWTLAVLPEGVTVLVASFASRSSEAVWVRALTS